MHVINHPAGDGIHVLLPLLQLPTLVQTSASPHQGASADFQLGARSTLTICGALTVHAPPRVQTVPCLGPNLHASRSASASPREPCPPAQHPVIHLPPSAVATPTWLDLYSTSPRPIQLLLYSWTPVPRTTNPPRHDRLGTRTAG